MNLRQKICKKQRIKERHSFVAEQFETGSRPDVFQSLFGNNDENMKKLEELLDVHIELRNGKITVEGSKAAHVDLADEIINQLYRLALKNEQIDPAVVSYAVSLAKHGKLDKIDSLFSEVIATTFRGRPIRCKTLVQLEYISAIEDHTLTFAVGPAGTGKTYLAVAMAVSALKAKQVERIVLTRPAVEAGEKLGFLPGDLNQKVDPYLRPLYDALYDMLGADTCQRLQERNVIEVAPLAYMRGRTLSDAFIILDEAQNTTREQMKMFLTRLGFRSKIIVTGDPSQKDLAFGKQSGLDEAVRVLEGVKGIAIKTLTSRDVVRHELVQRIVEAYEAYASDQEEQYGRKKHTGE